MQPPKRGDPPSAAPPPLAVPETDPDRFVQLFVLAFTGASGTLFWLSTAPCSDTLADYFGVSHIAFQTANLSFYIGALLGVVLVFVLLSYVPSSLGIRMMAILSASCIVTGAIIRIFAFPESVAGLVVLCLGNFVAALAAGLMISLATGNAIVFFATSEQTTATGLTLGGAGVGSAIGYILGAVMITDSSKQDMWIGLNAIILGVAVIALVLVLALVFDEPIVRPGALSVLEEVHRQKYSTFPSFWQGTTENADALFWVFVAQCVLGVGVYFTLQTILQSSMDDHGYSRAEQNTAGILFQLFGLFGTIGFALLVDHFHILRIGSIVAWWVALLMLILLGLYVTSDLIGTSLGGLYALSATSSIAFSSVPSVTLQVLCNAIYPIPAIHATLAIFFLAQISTGILLMTTTAVGGSAAWYILMVVLAVAAVLSIIIWWLPLRRDEMDARTSKEGMYTGALKPKGIAAALARRRRHWLSVY